MPSRNRTSNANSNTNTNTSKTSTSTSSSSATAVSTSTLTSATRSPTKLTAAKPTNTSTNVSPKPNPSSSSSSSPPPSPSSSSQPQSQITLPRNATNLVEISKYLWQDYTRTTPQRTKLLDIFLAFLAVVGAIQFVYCLVGGNYPYNAFLSGFSATVGQFVLTVSLRMQTAKENRAEFKGLSDERAFADYVFGSLLLHVFCINFIN